MRLLILAAGAALTVSACGGGSEAQNNDMAVENLAVDNLVMNDPAAMNDTMNMDMNATDNTQNAMMNDMTTNEADTNLANGM